MNKFEKVKYYYNYGLWDIERVRNAVRKEWITRYEYFLIIGQEY